MAGTRGAATYNRYGRKREEEEQPKQPRQPQKSSTAAPNLTGDTRKVEPAQPEQPKASAASATAPKTAAQPKALTTAEKQARTETAAEKAQLQALQRTIQEYSRQTKTLEKPGELVLPENMEKYRDILEKSNAAGMMGNGTTFGWTVNTVSVDTSSIKDIRQLAFFGTTLENDEDRLKLYENWAKENGMLLEDVLYQAENIYMPGMSAFDKPQSAKGTLKAAGLYDYEGNELDPVTANPAQIAQAIRMEPNKEKHDAMVDAYVALYGSIPKEELAFMDSADLTESDYKDEIKKFNAAFTLSDGHSIENQDAYFDLLDKIAYDYPNPRVQKQLQRDLSNSYYERTGVIPPTAEEYAAAMEEARKEAEEKGETGEGLGAWLKGKARDALNWIDSKIRGEDGTASETPSGEAPETTGEATPAEVQEPIQQETAFEAAPAEAAAEVQGPVQQTAEAPAEAQGPAWQPELSGQADAAQTAAQEPGAEQVVPYDPAMTAETALAYYRKGMTLDERNLDLIRFTIDNPNVRGALNSTGMYTNIPTDGAKRNTVDTFSYYGTSLGVAINTLSSGSLPSDMENMGFLAIGSVIDQIDEAVRKGNISIPEGMNMYEYMLNQPGNEGLKEQVSAVAGLQKQVNEAYAEHALAEKKAKEAALEADKAAVLAGTGNAAAAQRLAEAYGDEYTDLWEDDGFARYHYQVSYRGGYFADDGTFWENGSAAAQEGKNILTLGGKNGQTYGTYKTALKHQTYQVLETYTRTAHQLGMTLDEYLSGSGIGSIDQIVDIAYTQMLAEGKAYSEDTEAQEAVQTIATSSVGKPTSALLGVEYGGATRAESTLQTAEMVADWATHEQNVLDLTNDYYDQYGEMAPSMYLKDLNDYIASGALSEDQISDLQYRIDHANSIFDVGYEIDPGWLTGKLRMGRAEMAEVVDELEGIAAALPEDERLVFNVASGMSNSLIGMGEAVVVGGAANVLIPGSGAILGSAVAWGVPSYADSYDENRAKGMSPDMSAKVALLDATASTLLNTGGTGTQMDLIYGNSAYQGFKTALQSKGGRGLVTAIGKEIAKNAHQEGMEEVVEVLVGAGFDLMDNEFLALDRGEEFSLSRTFKSVTQNLMETDVAALSKEIAENYGWGALYGGIFSLAGVTETAYAAKKGAKMQAKYESVNLAQQMVAGDLPFTEVNIGEMYAALQKDLSDPKFCKWIDSSNIAAIDQNMTIAAMMNGAGGEARQTAVKEAQRANDYAQKAEAAKSASQTAHGRWWELREQVMNGDLDSIANMESARMLWGKAETTRQENETAAEKAKNAASSSTSEWLKACRAEGMVIKSQELARRMSQIANERQSLAELLAKQNEEVAYAENFVFADEAEDAYEAEDEETLRVVAMSDEELDAEIERISAQEGESQQRLADIQARSEELGMTEEQLQELTEQETSAISEQKNRIIARETDRFNDAFGRVQQALEMDSEEAADQIQVEYDQIAERLRKLGVDVDALQMAQYGVTSEQIAESEAASARAAEDEEHEKLTYSLSQRMEATSANLEEINPARKYLMSTPIYVNESQAADILAAEGLKNISQFNRRYGTKLTTDEKQGAMPLDGHVLSDISAEAAGTVQTDADPVSELLRVMQTGKELTSAQKQEKAEAKELTEKKKAVKKKRNERVDALINPVDISAIPIEDNVQKVAEMPIVSVLSGDEFEIGGTTLKDEVASFFESKGGVARNPVLGDVQMTKRGAKSSIGHKMNPRKAVAFAAIPDVIEKGEIVSAEKNWKARGWDTFVIAAPIQIASGNDAGDYICGVIVKRAGGTQHYYVHDVILDGDAEQEKKAATVPTKPGHPDETGEAIGSTEQPSFYSVLERVRDVKRQKVPKGNTPDVADIHYLRGGSQSGQTGNGQVKSEKRAKSPQRTIEKLVSDMGTRNYLNMRRLTNPRTLELMPKEVQAFFSDQLDAVFGKSIDKGRAIVAVHEIGHALDKRLSVKATQQMIDNLAPSFAQNYAAGELQGEAMAEFFVAYLTNPASAESFAGQSFIVDFERDLRRNGLDKAVHEARDEIQNFMSQSIEGQLASVITTPGEAKGGIVGRAIDAVKEAPTALLDETLPLADIQNAMREAMGTNVLPAYLDPRAEARMRQTSGLRAERFFDNAVTDANWNIKGKGLNERVGELNAEQVTTLKSYLLAKHTIDRRKQNKEVLDDFVFSDKRLEDFVADIEKNQPEIVKSAEGYYSWWNDVMQNMMVDTGFMNQQAFDFLKETYPHYIPTMRARKGGGIQPGGKGTFKVKRASGSTEDIIDPFVSLRGMVDSMVMQVSTNKVSLAFDRAYQMFPEIMAEYAVPVGRGQAETRAMSTKDVQAIIASGGSQEDAMNEVFRKMDEYSRFENRGTASEGNVLNVQHADGTVTQYKFADTDVLKAILGGGEKSVHTLASFAGNLNRFMSRMATSDNRTFSLLRNPGRDISNSINFGSWAYSYLDGIPKWVSSLIDVIRNTDDVKQYKATGAGGLSVLEADSKRSVEEFEESIFGEKSRKLSLSKIWDMATFQDLAEAFETASRYAEAKYGKNNIKKAKAKAAEGGYTEINLATRDVTTDFFGKGNTQVAKDLNAILPFFHAAENGVYRTIRMFTDKGERHRLIPRLTKTIINTAMASAGSSYLLMNDLDDEEKEDYIEYLSGNLKSQYWYLPNPFYGEGDEEFSNKRLIRVPIPQDPISYAVHGAVTNMFWKGETDELAIAAGDMLDTIVGSMVPVNSTIFDPVVNAAFNKTWYGGDIVPKSMTEYNPISPENQYDEETPQLAVALGGITGISPLKIDYVMEQYLGAPYKETKALLRDGPSGVLDIWEKSITSDPLASTDLTSRFYDARSFLEEIVNDADEAKSVYNLKAGLTQREVDAAVRDAQSLLDEDMDEAYDELKSMYAEINEINADEKLSSAQKNTLIREARRNGFKVVNQALGKVKAYQDQYGGGSVFSGIAKNKKIYTGR